MPSAVSSSMKLYRFSRHDAASPRIPFSDIPPVSASMLPSARSRDAILCVRSASLFSSRSSSPASGFAVLTSANISFAAEYFFSVSARRFFRARRSEALFLALSNTSRNCGKISVLTCAGRHASSIANCLSGSSSSICANWL